MNIMTPRIKGYKYLVIYAPESKSEKEMLATRLKSELLYGKSFAHSHAGDPIVTIPLKKQAHLL